MDIHSLSGVQLAGFIGEPVVITTESSKDAPISGNVFTIDPESKSIVLAVFKPSIQNFIKPKKFLLIPGETVRSIQKFLTPKTQLKEDMAVLEKDNCTSVSVRPNSKELRAALKDLIYINGQSSSRAAEPSCRLGTEEATSNENSGVIKQQTDAETRRQKIVAALQKADIAFKEDVSGGNNVIVVGAVHILHPYEETPECIISMNQVALKRTMNFLKGVTK